MGGLLERKKSSKSSSLIVLLYLFIVILLKRSVAVVSTLKHSHGKQARNLTFDMIQKHLEKINKPSVLAIESPDGDIIDCINIRKQLSFDHPVMKKHKLQLVPPAVPKRENYDAPNRRNEGRVARQVWHQNGTRCPKGTVPIRRTTIDDISRAGSLSEFGKKQPDIAFSRYNVPPQVLKHEYAYLSSAPSNVVYGATAMINLWNPNVELDTEFSLSQLWVVAGSYRGGDLNTVEAGWHVYPQMFGGDRSTRLFVYWTADAYQKTGCYNTGCSPGFVQVDQTIAVGAALSTVSGISGSQYQINLIVFKDQKTGNWWLFDGDIAVGYWPAVLFTRLAAGATHVEWGGEVINRKASGAHTSTQMGSGHFAHSGPGKASFFQWLGVVNSGNYIISPESLSSHSTNSNCYSVAGPRTTQGNNIFFYYGGPGRNPQCP